MFDVLVGSTGVVILLGGMFAYWKSQDALHPAVVVAPVMGYIYGLWPLLLNMQGELVKLFGVESLNYVGMLYLASIAAFYYGLCQRAGQRPAVAGRGAGTQDVFGLEMTPLVRRRLYYLAVLMGLLSLAAYVHMLDNAGGFVKAYSRYKGGGWASSGYIGEAVLLSFPAVLLLALSRQKARSVRSTDIVLGILVCLPHLLQGTFGGRRGPLFLVLLVMLLAWYIAHGRRPSLKRIVSGIAIIGLAVVVVQSQRKYIYLGSEGDFEAERVIALIRPAERLSNNDYVTGVSTVLTVAHFKGFYWGKRYLITIFIRPIPKQIWPTKYEDVGADWLTAYDPNDGGSDFLEAVGFLPAAGSAPGFLADIYNEFSVGVVVVVYLFGRGLAGLWRRHRVRGGMWTVLFAEAMILCVYLPTQSFSAWFHRFIFMALISALVWRFWIGRPMPKLRLEHRQGPDDRSVPAAK